MGAGEKHAATYHGGKYTPGTLDVNNCYRQRWYEQSEAQSDAEFNRWLAKVRAEAKAEALKEAADALFEWSESPFMCLDECGSNTCPDDIRLGAGKDIQKWLRGRATKIKKTP